MTHAGDVEADASPTQVVRDAVVVLGAFAVVATVAGLLWPHLVTPVQLTRNDFGVATDEVALSERFDNDGWYAVLAGGCGLVLGAVMSYWRRAHEVVTLLLSLAGAFLAAWLMAAVGTWAGPEDPAVVLENAEVGASATGMVTVSADAAYLVWPIATLVGALLVLWSQPGEPLVRRREAPELPVERAADPVE